MPVYDYKCPSCNTITTLTRAISLRDDNLPICARHKPPTPMKRTVSRGTGFVLKGEGWASSGYSK